MGLACCHPAYAEVTQTRHFWDTITPQSDVHFLIPMCLTDTSCLIFFLSENVKVKLSLYRTFELQEDEAHRIYRHLAHEGGKVVSPVHLISIRG